MLFKDYKKSYVEFCREELLREIILSKRRFLRKERIKTEECILNTKNENGIEMIDLIIGDNGLNLTGEMTFEETLENEELREAMGLLSKDERKVVSLRFRDGLNVKQINVIMGYKRYSSGSDVCQRALRKLREEVENEE